MVKAADDNKPPKKRRSSPGYKGIIDAPFPAYESVPREELKAAYAWELDREFLDEAADQRRPWPRLRAFERNDITERVGHPVFDIEEPPRAAFLYPPDYLLKDKHEHPVPCVMGLTEEQWYEFHLLQHRHKRAGKKLTDDDPANWKHLEDGHGNLRVVLGIDLNQPLEDVLDHIKAELSTLHSFPAKTPPKRQADWASRLCDLLCLRLERAGLTWKAAFEKLEGFKRAHGLAGVDTQKHWSTRRGKAKQAIEQRRRELMKRVRLAVEDNERRYQRAQPRETWEPIVTWSLMGWPGPQAPVGRAKPHECLEPIVGALLLKPFYHFLALNGLTTESEGVDWAGMWFAFKEWDKENPNESARLSGEGWDEWKAAIRKQAQASDEQAPCE